jgi:hypothetical protein
MGKIPHEEVLIRVFNQATKDGIESCDILGTVQYVWTKCVEFVKSLDYSVNDSVVKCVKKGCSCDTGDSCDRVFPECGSRESDVGEDGDRGMRRFYR